MADEGMNKVFAIIMLIFLMGSGFVLLLNLIPYLDIGFNDAGSIMGWFWTIVLRIFVAPAIIGVCGYAIYKIVTD